MSLKELIEALAEEEKSKISLQELIERLSNQLEGESSLNGEYTLLRSSDVKLTINILKKLKNKIQL